MQAKLAIDASIAGDRIVVPVMSSEASRRMAIDPRYLRIIEMIKTALAAIPLRIIAIPNGETARSSETFMVGRKGRRTNDDRKKPEEGDRSRSRQLTS